MRNLATNLKPLALGLAGPVVFLASLPWLDEQPDFVVYLASALAALWVLSISLVVSARSDRAADEWERSGSRFSFFWGGMAGYALVAFLLVLPPMHALIVRLAAWGQGLNVAEIDRTMAILMFAAGFVAVGLAQALCTMAFLFLWRRKTLGRPE